MSVSVCRHSNVLLCSRHCALRSSSSSSLLTHSIRRICAPASHRTPRRPLTPISATSPIHRWTAQRASPARGSETPSPHLGTQQALRIGVYLLFPGSSPLLPNGTGQRRFCSEQISASPCRLASAAPPLAARQQLSPPAQSFALLPPLLRLAKQPEGPLAAASSFSLRSSAGKVLTPSVS
jgi:hypothetical protein